MNGFRWAINLLFVVIGGAIYLWVGIEWSRSAWARGGLEFDQGWLLVALLVSQSIATSVAPSTTRHTRWLRIGATAAGGFGLEAVADHFFVVVRTQPERTGLAYFIVFALAFILYVIAWIIIFPYEASFGPVSQKVHGPWRMRVFITGVLVAATIVGGTIHVYYGAGVPAEAIESLQSWFYKAALLVYLFLALRMFYPALEKRLGIPAEGTADKL